MSHFANFLQAAIARFAVGRLNPHRSFTHGRNMPSLPLPASRSWAALVKLFADRFPGRLVAGLGLAETLRTIVLRVSFLSSKHPLLGLASSGGDEDSRRGRRPVSRLSVETTRSYWTAGTSEPIVRQLGCQRHSWLAVNAAGITQRWKCWGVRAAGRRAQRVRVPRRERGKLKEVRLGGTNTLASHLVG